MSGSSGVRHWRHRGGVTSRVSSTSCPRRTGAGAGSSAFGVGEGAIGSCTTGGAISDVTGGGSSGSVVGGGTASSVGSGLGVGSVGFGPERPRCVVGACKSDRAAIIGFPAGCVAGGAGVAGFDGGEPLSF